MNSDRYNFIKFISYKALSLWDVKRYVQNHMSYKNAVKLSEVLTSSIEPVTKAELLSNNWQIISKITFAGELFLRNTNEANTFKGNLYKVSSDSLIYSKINVRHGCIYYHPIDAIPFAVSSEYPVYKIDSTKVLGDYLVMVIQSNGFKSILNKKATGISKARVKPTEFLETEIPIPSLSIQKELLRRFNDSIYEAQELERKAIQIEEGIKSYTIDLLGATTKQAPKGQEGKYKYWNMAHFIDVAEWGVDIIQKKQKKVIFKYPMVKIKDICLLGSGGTPSRSCPQYYKGNIPWIKTGEVLNEEIFETEEHITEDAIANSSVKLYPKGSLIIAMYGQGDTRGRTAKLGIDATTNQACAVLHDIDNNVVSTDYLWYYLQGRYDDLRSLASGNNQPNLNAGKINNYDVVVPPMDVQNEMVAHIKEQKTLAKLLKQKAQEIRENALKEFENEIFE
jgi:type I restriction enzyme S subunit